MGDVPVHIPLIIGFTGHRDLQLQDLDSLSVSVKTVLTEIQAALPDTPLIVLSALAEGADRLCAQAALACGARLFVPLPMPIEEYMKDFVTESSQEEFKALLAKAEHYFEVPLDNTITDPVQYNGENRNYFYEQLAVYLSKTSQILVALWDGVNNFAPGGTAATVKFKLESMPPKQRKNNSILLNTQNPGQIYIISTPHKSNPIPSKAPFSINKFTVGSNELDETFAEIEYSDQDCLNFLTRINTFNKDVKRLWPKITSKIPRSKDDVLPSSELSKWPQLNAILNVFAAADQLSLYFQKLRLLSLRLTLSIGVLLVLLFLLYDEMEADIMLPIYLLAFIFVVVFYFISSKREYHTKFIDYRSLAEGLKVQAYWDLAGLPFNVDEHYLWSQKSEMAWIRNAVQNCHSLKKDTFSPRTEGQRLKLIEDTWLKGQLNYFSRSAVSTKSRLKKLRFSINTLFFLSLLFVSGITVMEFYFKDTINLVPNQISYFIDSVIKPHEGQQIMLRNYLKIAMGVIAALIAVCTNYSEKLALAEQLRDKVKMYHLFETASELLSRAQQQEDYPSAQKIITELGKEVLAENGNWVLLHRERPIELPK